MNQFKLYFSLLTILFALSSCTHKYIDRAPDFEVKTKKEQLAEEKKFKMAPYKIPLPHYYYFNFQGKRTRPDDVEHVLENTRNGTLYEWKQHHWGAYMAWVAAIPMAIFAKEVATDFGITNLFLFGASAGAFGYGSMLEMQHKNRIIQEYNRELKIKLDLIKADF